MKQFASLAFCISIFALLIALAGCGGSDEHATTFATSQLRIEKLAQAMLAYAADNDGTLPGKDWMDATTKYVKDDQAYRSPAVGGDGYGFAFNEDLVGKKLSSINDRSSTILLFDSTIVVRNAIAGVSSMPTPARYGSANTVAYADGVVKDKALNASYAEASKRLRMLGTALLAYSADYDDRLPLPANWMDALGPFVSSQEAFHDPSVEAKQFGFALNKDVAGKETSKIGALGTTPVLFSSTALTRNATESLTALPSPGRYAGKNAIYYLDGHVSTEIEKPNVKDPVVPVSKSADPSGSLAQPLSPKG